MHLQKVDYMHLQKVTRESESNFLIFESLTPADLCTCLEVQRSNFGPPITKGVKEQCRPKVTADRTTEAGLHWISRFCWRLLAGKRGVIWRMRIRKAAIAGKTCGAFIETTENLGFVYIASRHYAHERKCLFCSQNITTVWWSLAG
nr:uncharacterized protein LOC127320881 [Lolium perenne]